MKFIKSFEKTAAMSSSALDKAGLGALAIAPAVHTYKAIKNKDKGEAALGATEVGGLGLLYRAVQKAHP
jgi:hypothetical protein